MPLAFADELPHILPKFIPLYEYESEPSEWKPFRFSPESLIPSEKLHIFTWNLNHQGKHRRERMRDAIRHIREQHLSKFSDSDIPPPCIICLQEVHKAALEALLRISWIRQHFLVTPTNAESWVKEKYGLVTIISKNIPVSRAFIIDLPMTEMDRQALIIDIHVKCSEANGDDSIPSGDQRVRTIRIANAHLEGGAGPTESLARERQLRHIAGMLNVPKLDASICAGSFGACMEEDTDMIANAGFADAYTGRKWASETWGVQPNSKRYGKSRMDRILYLPTDGAKLRLPKRVGLCATIRNSDSLFVSDHLGLHTVVEIVPDKV
ncbi:hypothetical protein M422DRAFT_227899 [Sphaerobolus stellatus SS14]|uniref:Endonuclease/exonuclease/phosphatase domain-containing protein n=1 Tax=Sphaerobolus stellatus (strain SS14) TaxID=990650 RepID=A0A0C9W2F3_SPHS4|nr:hypothetical protein M422DRAFT_227899 [Sphaerobolus stellatus SS14]